MELQQTHFFVIFFNCIESDATFAVSTALFWTAIFNEETSDFSLVVIISLDARCAVMLLHKTSK